MKKAITIALVLVLALSLLTACGGKDSGGSSTTTPPANSSTPGTSQDAENNGSGQQLITEDRTTGDGSMAREQYYAETVRKEFTFDKSGVLTGYKTIYYFATKQ